MPADLILILVLTLDLGLDQSQVKTSPIVAKRCEIRQKLILITNMKSHIGFQMTLK